MTQSVEFTEEELEAVNISMKRFAAIADADAPEGMMAVVSAKLKDAMVAHALTEYVGDLVAQREEDRSKDEKLVITDKALKAQLKAYVIHNLPPYLFQAAAIAEFMGDAVGAQNLYREFLRAQDKFEPDDLDISFLDLADLDLPAAIVRAKEKVT